MGVLLAKCDGKKCAISIPLHLHQVAEAVESVSDTIASIATSVPDTRKHNGHAEQNPARDFLEKRRTLIASNFCCLLK